MPQLSIIPSVFPQPNAGIGQALAFAAEGGDVLEIDPGLDFGAILAKQLKGVATLCEQKEDAGLPLAPVNEDAEFVLNAGMMTLPVDFSAIAATAFLPAPPVQVGVGSGISAETAPEKTLMYLNGIGVKAGISSISAEVGAEKPLMYRNGSEVVTERSSISVDVGVKNLLTRINDNEVKADMLRIPAEAGSERLFIHLNNNGEKADISNIPDEAGSEESLMRLSGNSYGVKVEISSVSAEVGGGKSMMYRNVSEVVTERSRILTEVGEEKKSMGLSRMGEARVAAEIAATGGNLPQATSSELRFVDKFAVWVKIPVENAGEEIPAVDLPVGVSPPATALAFRNSEPLPALQVVPRVGSVEWSGAMGEKVVWMANQSHQVAELHLNPPNLGPLEVRLTISNDQASALFVSHHFAVREAIETALPRLREMLADNGIMLGNVMVGAESFSQRQASEQRDAKEGGRGGMGVENAVARIASPAVPAVRVRDGMVDIFA